MQRDMRAAVAETKRFWQRTDGVLRVLPPIEPDQTGQPTMSIRSGTFILRKDGILVGLPTSVDVTLTDAKEMVEAMKKLHPQEHGKLLLDQRRANRKLLPEARIYLAEHTKQFDRIAILVGSAISRFLASGILMVTGQSKKVQAFESEAAAVAWLHADGALRSR
jgi:hypothetical protein